MFCLAYIRTKAQGVIGVTLPDFKVYTMADAVQELPERLLTAIADQYRGPIPKTSHLEEFQGDDRYRGGWWLFLNLDVERLATRRGRTRQTKKHA